ncbi:hypothetical protein Cgig2_023128 [Carnegiea gigantea]|uniref:Uncharacterized protein n=1 Tax=Carnegiea gigantea TaxID=171969 RepID=A0A9Q1JRK3_9CARY|nr:hypothetical protein Cgig2_023128 [Carnegiea gigantea]
MKVKLTCKGIGKHDTRNLSTHRTFGISPCSFASPLATMFKMWNSAFATSIFFINQCESKNRKLFEVVVASEQRFLIQQVISHIADGSTELQKSPNEAEVHGLTHDEHFFNHHEFFDAYLKMEALVLKHYQHQTPMNYTPLTFDLAIPLSPECRIPTTISFPIKGTHIISNSPT